LTKLSDINNRFRRIAAWKRCERTQRLPKSLAIARSPSKALRRAISEESAQRSNYNDGSRSLELRVMVKENIALHAAGHTNSLVEESSARRVHLRRLYAQVNPRNLITIVDSGADLWIFGVGWRVLTDWKELFFCSGAFFSTDKDEVSCRLVSAAAVFYFPGMDICPILVHVHRGLHNEDPNQVESLASPHQMMAHSCLVDMVPSIHLTRQGTPGTQGMTVSGKDIPFTFDGVKLFMHHREPTDHELNTMSAVDLTSETEWKPWNIVQERVNQNRNLGVIITRRRKLQDVSVERWQANLGYAPRDVILRTLARTTQLAPHVSSNFRDVPQRHLASQLLMFQH
jgi:hypothetical protein